MKESKHDIHEMCISHFNIIQDLVEKWDLIQLYFYKNKDGYYNLIKLLKEKPRSFLLLVLLYKISKPIKQPLTKTIRWIT